MAEYNYDDIVTYDTPAYKPRKKRFGDRPEGYRVRTLFPMTYVMPFIMKERDDAHVYFEDVIDITNAELFLDEKHRQGMVDMSLLHIILAAYVRVVAERPGLNRFVSGQRIYARSTIDVNMAVKRQMSIEGEDTMIKVQFDPRDNVDNVFKKFQKVMRGAITAETDFNDTARVLSKLPRFLFRAAISLINFADYYGLLPKFLLNVSPFHGSMIITSMGSLGIPAIYHHIYNFGNLPVFLSYGSIYSAEAIRRDGQKERHHFVTFKVVADERICDGYYYAAAFKKLKRYVLHPEMLEETLTEVKEDID